MQLHLTNDNPTNTVFVGEDSRPIYTVETSKAFFKTPVTTIIPHNGNRGAAGNIEWHNWGKTIVSANGRSYTPAKSSRFST